MLTIFSIPKVFKGHINVIQRNAIMSWTLLRPRPEIVLFGDETGTAEVVAELGLRHNPEAARNEFGTPLLNDLFAKAQADPNADLLCYVNTDVILLQDFMEAVERTRDWSKHKTILVTASRGLIGSEAVEYFDARGTAGWVRTTT